LVGDVDDVGEAIVVDVGDNGSACGGGGGLRLRRLEGAVSVAGIGDEWEADAVDETSAEQIGLAVSVEVAGAEKAELNSWCGITCGGRERAGGVPALVEKNGNRRCIGDGDVREAVGVEIGWGNEEGCGGDAIVGGLLEGAVAIAEEDRDEAMWRPG
jgi:hypothetical protein